MRKKGTFLKWSKKQQSRVKALRHEGLSIKEIAAQTHIPKGTVGGWLVGISKEPPVEVMPVPDDTYTETPNLGVTNYSAAERFIASKDFDLVGVIKAIENLVNKVAVLEEENGELRASNTTLIGIVNEKKQQDETDKGLWNKLSTLMLRIK